MSFASDWRRLTTYNIGWNTPRMFGRSVYVSRTANQEDRYLLGYLLDTRLASGRRECFRLYFDGMFMIKREFLDRVLSYRGYNIFKNELLMRDFVTYESNLDRDYIVYKRKTLYKVDKGGDSMLEYVMSLQVA
jgi:hypothetical protein